MTRKDYLCLVIGNVKSLVVLSQRTMLVSRLGRSIRVIPICCNCSQDAIALNFDSIASIDYNVDFAGSARENKSMRFTKVNWADEIY